MLFNGVECDNIVAHSLIIHQDADIDCCVDDAELHYYDSPAPKADMVILYLCSTKVIQVMEVCNKHYGLIKGEDSKFTNWSRWED